MVKKFVIACGATLIAIFGTSAIAQTTNPNLADIYGAYKNESVTLIQLSNNPPYSIPTRYKDEFTGIPYAAVFDNSFNPSLFGTTTGLLTSWGSNPTTAFVRAILYAKTANPCGLIDCSRSGTQVKFESLEVKAGDKAFYVTERSPRGSFILNQEQVQILLNAPENENAKVRLTDSEGKSYIYEIGTGTVKSWKTVYAPIK